MERQGYSHLKTLLIHFWQEWRSLLRSWHPDKNPEKAEVATAVFQFLQKARDTFAFKNSIFMHLLLQRHIDVQKHDKMPINIIQYLSNSKSRCCKGKLLLGL